MKLNRTSRVTQVAVVLCALLPVFSVQAENSLNVHEGLAFAALMHGRVEDATSMLRQSVAANTADARTHLLLCRAEYAQERGDVAVSECQAAATAMPHDSETQMWLGRALGMKASHANPIAAFNLARQVRTAFERAVQLDPANLDAASDLGQFYIAAPSIVGGGDDKLVRLADSLESRSPARAHRLRGLLAQKNRNLALAEGEFKQAVAAGRTPQAYSDLALFYELQNRPDDAMAAAAQALSADRERTSVQFDVATILIAAKRAPEVAERAMRNYLNSPAQNDDAPVFKVHLELGKLLARRGDKAGAKVEYAAAVALAPHFEPARQALGGA